MYLLIINLDKSTLNEMVFIGLTVGDCHNLTKGARNNAHSLLLKFEAGNHHRQVLFVVIDHLGSFC